LEKNLFGRNVDNWATLVETGFPPTGDRPTWCSMFMNVGVSTARGIETV
jgi:hypothetical protein